MNEGTGPAATAAPSGPPKKRGGGAVGSALAKAAGGLVGLTTKIFGEVTTRSGSALADFRARPEHSRWRAYALGCYGLILAGTFGGQLYTSNGMGAYVRVQRVELPAMTQIFVRNDSRKPWTDVTLTLNGIYEFHASEVSPGGHVMLPVNKFALRDPEGKPTFAPKNIAPKTLTIQTNLARYETELGE